MHEKANMIEGQDYLVKFYDEIWHYQAWQVMTWRNARFDCAWITREVHEVTDVYLLEDVIPMCEEFLK